jgi:ABC-type Fe3+-citrate transport system substrate-binding protein
MINMTESNKASDNISTSIDYTTPTPRFSVTNENTLNDGITYLNEHGYVVISDIMNQDEINFNKDLLWKFLENISNNTIQRNDPETWTNEW